jgi:hypothetical protein
MIIGGVARRPGLVLAACIWAAFAALASAAVLEAVTINASIRSRIFAAANGSGNLPTLCLVVAAMLVLIEHLSAATHEPAVRLLARALQASAIVAAGITAAGVVVLPTWSSSTSVAEWIVAISPYLTAAALAVLAAMLAELATRRVTVPEVGE